MALRKVKGNLERIFDKNLTDLVRGIRNNKDNETKYIAQCIEEIKEELRQENISVKSNAVAKLTYLQMLGYDISWAAFNIIEVMSSTKFTFKRIGYLAASQSFHEDTEVLMLTTNMIRKHSSVTKLETGKLSGVDAVKFSKSGHFHHKSLAASAFTSGPREMRSAGLHSDGICFHWKSLVNCWFWDT
ncbi:AP-3 complex subunit delta [Araneus ventricosus]|uniref:AP-3 complex subunit delta n=1 Tax=Araneus ventricosus TaxID=182803 RepID=A0A4Y2FT57_ARAVE|nr:AP-3 complex subunit delta [Araneus ventricosus]